MVWRRETGCASIPSAADQSMRALAARVFGWYSAPMSKTMTLTQQQRRTDIVAILKPNLATPGGVFFRALARGCQRPFKMTFTSDAEIKSTTDAFMAKTLPKPDWTHEAHFAVALCLLADETRDVFREMPLRIRAYNEATGVANTETEGYHETITLAC